jgi:hypothetical protein
VPPGPLARPVVTFGRVPLFFYLPHIPLIHGAAVLCDWVRFGWSPLATAGPWDVRREEVPESYGLSLPMVYLVWAGAVSVVRGGEAAPARRLAELLLTEGDGPGEHARRHPRQTARRRRRPPRRGP